MGLRFPAGSEEWCRRRYLRALRNQRQQRVAVSGFGGGIDGRRNFRRRSAVESEPSTLKRRTENDRLADSSKLHTARQARRADGLFFIVLVAGIRVPALRFH